MIDWQGAGPYQLLAEGRLGEHNPNAGKRLLCVGETDALGGVFIQNVPPGTKVFIEEPK